MRKEITEFDRYLESLHQHSSVHLKVIEEALKEDGKWGINIGLVEGLIIQWMIKSQKVSKVLEIGTQYGYSTQWMLEALPQNGKIVTLEKDPAHHAKAQSLIKDPRVKFMLGDGKVLMPQLESEAPFDLIFIDANKKSYPIYLQWAEKLLKKGGLIIGDNTLLFGQVVKEKPDANTSEDLWAAMREFNKAIFSNPHFAPCFIPTSEGLTLAYKL
jgi:predicted O-methyltransferase YrrM